MKFIKTVFNISGLNKLFQTKLIKDDKGQIIVFMAVSWAIFAAGIISVFNIGTLVGERIKIQQVADNAAYSGAVWECRGLNYTAYCNRAIVANISFLAYLCAMESHLQAWKDLARVLRLVPYVGAVAAVIESILDFLINMVRTIKDSPLWDISISSLSMAENLFLISNPMQVRAIMDNVVRYSDNNMHLQFSPMAMNSANFSAIYKRGTEEELRYVVKETLSPWTKSEKEGQAPIFNRSYLALPRSWESFLKYLPGYCNAGIAGTMELNNRGIKSTDYGYLVYYKWKRFSLRRRTQRISPVYESSRNINWNQIIFYTMKDRGGFWGSRVTRPGVYAAVEKMTATMSSILTMEFLRAPFGANPGESGLFSVPGGTYNKMVALSKARASYQDPFMDSDRHRNLSANNKEPNMFNPFWRAELVAFEGTSSEDVNQAGANALISQGWPYKRH